MLFNSIEFAIFLPLIFVLYWFIFPKNRKAQNLLLMGASYMFYGWWDWRFLGLILFSSILDFFAGKFIESSKRPKLRKAVLSISLVGNLGLLATFKYYDFFILSLQDSLSVLGVAINLRTLNLILPVGISFYTFQTMSYSIDVYRRKMNATKSLVDFMAFVSFFPQLVAGPIERASSLLPQFGRERVFYYSNFSKGAALILWGLFKKIVIADNAAIYVNQIFDNYELYQGITLFIGAFLFAFQIYCDFSGYSDIAIGTALLFGFELMRNFDYPYFSSSISAFWRRWHISLSSWFRDYLYIPLGGSRGSGFKRQRNILLVFIVSGIWHGANWTFFIWGMLHAIYYQLSSIRIDNRLKRHFMRLPQKGKEMFGILKTFFVVTIAWIFFRAPTISEALDYVRLLFFKGWFFDLHVPTPKAQFAYTIVLLIGFIIFEWCSRNKEFPLELSMYSWKVRWSIYYIVFLLIITFGFYGENEFIYFAF